MAAADEIRRLLHSKIGPELDVSTLATLLQEGTSREIVEGVEKLNGSVDRLATGTEKTRECE